MKTSRDFHYLNFAANILVVLIGTILIGLVTYRAFFQPPISVEAERLKTGESFNELKEVDFQNNSDTILLAADIKCQYCTQSLPFYKKLIARSKQNPAVRIIAVFNNKSEEIESYLREHDVPVQFIPNVDLIKLKVDATPTIIWVDANRKIVGSYQGILQEKQESSFFEVYEKRLPGK